MKESYLRRHTNFFWKKYRDIDCVSRKTKKAILGRKMNRRKLKESLAAVVVAKMPYPQSAEISDVFCPCCGCKATRSTGNMAEYPERWEKIFCLRCDFLVEMSDNSPYYHCLEFSEDNYVIEG